MKCKLGLTYLKTNVEVFIWSRFCESPSLLKTTTFCSLHVPQAMQYRVPNVLDTACHLGFITEILKCLAPFYIIPHYWNVGTHSISSHHRKITIANIDIKFETHFTSTSSRAQKVLNPLGPRRPISAVKKNLYIPRQPISSTFEIDPRDIC
jgi:hypothetical protein